MRIVKENCWNKIWSKRKPKNLNIFQWDFFPSSFSTASLHRYIPIFFDIARISNFIFSINNPAFNGKWVKTLNINFMKYITIYSTYFHISHYGILHTFPHPPSYLADDTKSNRRFLSTVEKLKLLKMCPWSTQRKQQQTIRTMYSWTVSGRGELLKNFQLQYIEIILFVLEYKGCSMTVPSPWGFILK